jgi:hypothetical protein
LSNYFFILAWARSKCWRTRSCIIVLSDNHSFKSGISADSPKWRGVYPYRTSNGVLPRAERKLELHQNLANDSHCFHLEGQGLMKHCR